ncbi:hypothetical protein GCM10011326_11040 [Salipiger profundus]|mgnify:CR=1 FL=1|jgi:hypothetical protein|nr:hypothetical protein GCM10011326_11040 [Salipiger profundus]
MTDAPDWRLSGEACECSVHLLAQVPANVGIAALTTEGAYGTRACLDAIAARGAAAIIPVPQNARPWKRDAVGVRTRNEIL